jgi:hypothetical protein
MVDAMKDTIIDSNEHREHTPLLSGVAGIYKFPGRPVFKYVAGIVHPVARLGFVAERFQRAGPTNSAVGFARSADTGWASISSSGLPIRPSHRRTA